MTNLSRYVKFSLLYVSQIVCVTELNQSKHHQERAGDGENSRNMIQM